MSEVTNNAAPAAEAPVTDPVPESKPTETSAVEEAPKTDATPAVDAAKPTESEATPVTKDDEAEEKKDEVAAAADKKPVEPITEGQLAVKGPGLLKSIIPSKKEFWLSEDAITPQDLSSYMRGEKPEIAHPVVAWASQTGKGLLFFNKKGDTTRKQPGHVLALYDATELKKQAPHEVAFKLHGQEHVLKASNDAERDGWYLSIEKGIEIGKASKEEVRESEGYKACSTDKPTVAASAAAVSSKRGQSQPKKSMEADKTDAAAAERKNSDVAEDAQKDKKARSTSRGVLGRLKSKKDELETKKEEKKEEKNEEPAKTDDHHAEEVAGGAAVAGAAGTAAVVAEDKKDETTEATPAETKKEEQPKPAKRGSIFGKMQGWGSVKSPSKEKDQKEAELKPEVPPKDTPVAETAPQLPETTTTEPAEETAASETEAKPEVAAEKKDEPTSATTPGKEKSNFLSGLPFMNKRNRSVSPSANVKDSAEETPAVGAPKDAETAAPAEEIKSDDAVPAVAESTAIEPLKEEPAAASTTPNKRQSVLGNLGRRASKAFKGMQSPAAGKKENAAPTAAATETKTEATPAATSTETPATNGLTNGTSAAEEPKQQIGDVVPEAVNIGTPSEQPKVVAASA